MDAFDFHPYPDRSRIPVDLAAPAVDARSRSPTTASSSACSRTAFDGTAQPGAKLPIYYNEFGVQSTIPLAAQARVHEPLRPGRDATRSPRRSRPTAYTQAIDIAYCQPTVKAFLIFHVSDEPDLDRWQSGVFYADDKPKSSLGAGAERPRSPPARAASRGCGKAKVSTAPQAAPALTRTS